MSEVKIGKVLLPSLTGNLLEWYDFSLYGYFAKTIGEQFFPGSDPLISLLKVYGLFAVSFLVRPVGSLIFGYYGDKYGRQKAFSLAIILMALPTALIGCVPTVAMWGIWAPIALISCRLVQGIAMGGQFGGSMVYVLEHTPPNRRGFLASLIMSSAHTGILFGCATSALISKIFEGSPFEPHAWRIPFWLGIILALIGVYCRRKLPETPTHQQMGATHSLEENPTRFFFQHYTRTFFKAIAAMSVPVISFYLMTVFFVSYFQTEQHLTKAAALLLNTVCLGFIFVFSPFFGWLSDRIGERKLLMSSAVLYFFAAPILYFALQHCNDNERYLILLGFVILTSMASAITPSFLFKLYEGKIRYTGISLTHNLAYGVLGGTAPLIATQLLRMTNSLLSLAAYTMIFCVIMGGALYALPYASENEND